MTVPIERSIDLADAKKNIEHILQESGVIWNIETTGRFVVTAKCTLYDKSGEYLDFGYGKGEFESAVVGALFEASEHYFSRYERADNSNVVHKESLLFLKESRLNNNLPISIIGESPNGSFPLREYTPIGKSGTILYPVALSTPTYLDGLDEGLINNPLDTFNYKHLERYCTNSGVAIGSNETEAIIHGLLESIERDTLSAFLVNVYLYKDPQELRIVIPTTLPLILHELYLDVMREVEGDVDIYFLKNDYEIPVFCSSLRNSEFEIEITGYGCSLSKSHALARSLYELVQCYHASTAFHPESVRLRDNNVLGSFKEHPFHEKCAKLKLFDQCNDIGSTAIDFDLVVDFAPPIETEEYLEFLVSIIDSKDRVAYSSNIYSDDRGSVVVHSFIEKQDHFFGVTEGCLVFSERMRLDHKPKSREAYNNAN
ncbi:MAG: YcaO-like family protein [Candidatus Thiodiazotropha taylori]|nr:YcaO-like family protein [Candidatus Thiodiazotropha taylori]